MNRYFLQIRVKVVLLLSLLLALLFSGFILLNSNNAKTIFNVERQALAAIYDTQFNEHLKQTHRQLTVFSQHFFNSLDSSDIGITSEAQQALEQAFDLLPVSISVRDASGYFSAQLGDADYYAAVFDWLSHPQGRSSDWLFVCQQDCYIYFVIPPVNGEMSQTIVYEFNALPLIQHMASELGQNYLLAQIATDRKRYSSGADHIPMETDDYFQLFGMELTDLSGVTALGSYLTHKDISSGLAYIQLPEQWIEVHSLKLTQFGNDASFYILSLADISIQMELMDTAQQQNGLLALVTGMLILLLIAFLIHGPIYRVNLVTQALPLLASSRYYLFRQMVSESTSQFMDDESDKLAIAALNISKQLQRSEENLKSQINEIKWIANHDPLTHLLSRRKFEADLSKIVSDGCSGCLLLIDLDNFKYVNDISGHSTGDEMLCQVANSLQRLLPDNSLIARASGDEFAVYLFDTDIGIAEAMALRISKLIGEIRAPGVDTIHTASISIGIVAYGLHDSTAAGMMSKASQAKAQGKRCVEVYQAEGHQGDIALQHYWLDIAQNAIARNRLQLFFQPIQNNRTQTVQHYEVLLRVQDNDGQLQSPYELILSAEKNGFITQIDLWVLQNAMAQVEINLKLGIKVRLAINLSARTFCSTSAINQIIHEFTKRDITGNMVIFEITETASLPNMEQAKLHIRQLKAIGCGIALDDFGVGYSSFHSLKELDLDYIKIDGSFVKGIVENKKDRYFIQALVSLAHDLGYLTIAEFVESEALNDQVAHLGVDYSQGYYVGKPAPANQVWPHERTTEVLSLRACDRKNRN